MRPSLVALVLAVSTAASAGEVAPAALRRRALRGPELASRSVPSAAGA